MSEHIEQFNNYCAKVLKYVIGRFEDHPVYYTPDGYYVIRKNEFDPYNKFEQAGPVVDELLARFGITMNVEIVEKFGYTAAARELILHAIAKHPLDDEGNLKTSEMVEENDLVDDGMDGVGNDILRMIRERQAENDRKDKEDQIKTFNGHCAAIMGWTRNGDGVGPLYYNVADEYVAEVEYYNPHGNTLQLQKALNILKDDYGLVPEGSSSESARQLIWWYVAFGSECPKKKEEDFHHDLDVNSQYQEPPPVWQEPPIEDRVGEIFNKQCIDVVEAESKSRGYRIALPRTFDPYNNTGDLLYTLEVILKKLPDEMNFVMWGGENRDNITAMREFVEEYATDKYMLSEEDQFNKMCAGLVEAYDIVDCQPIDDTFDPYDNINDLTPIVSVIIETVGVGFTIEAPSIEYDIHNRLRAYAQEYGPEVLDLMVGA